jgi:hypothetical protein
MAVRAHKVALRNLNAELLPSDVVLLTNLEALLFTRAMVKVHALRREAAMTVEAR